MSVEALARRFLRDRRAVVGLAIVVMAALAAVLAPVISPHSPHALVGEGLARPGGRYVMGTDRLGRDVLSRLIWGTRISLLFALGAASLSLVLGVVLGLIPGYFGGWVDHLFSRVFEVFLTLPRLFLILLVSALFGTRATIGVVVVGLTIWPSNARLMRAQVMSLKARPFVEAATALGATPWRIMGRHLLPNAINPVVANTTLQIAGAILIEASLGFLGLSDVNLPSWGQMLRDAQAHLQKEWWLAVFPGLAISTLVLGFTFLGDGIGRSLDPRQISS
ncbi:MAG: ABC transporter permease [Armatimonadetes bacterium]|nr:ABC transporter permease [Armatimonadota bacterium]